MECIKNNLLTGVTCKNAIVAFNNSFILQNKIYYPDRRLPLQSSAMLPVHWVMTGLMFIKSF